MFKYLLLSIVIAPVLIGIVAAKRVRGLPVLMAGGAAYFVFYVGMLYFLKTRWVG